MKAGKQYKFLQHGIGILSHRSPYPKHLCRASLGAIKKQMQKIARTSAIFGDILFYSL